MRTDDLATVTIAALVERFPRVDWAALDEVILGCANQAGEDNRNVARMAVLLAGLPDTVPGVTVNRLCASGLEAVGQAARAIRLGEAEMVWPAGSRACLARRSSWARPAGPSPATRSSKTRPRLAFREPGDGAEARHRLDDPDGGELAREHGIERSDQDAYALRSQERAERARANGWLAEEIVPVAMKAGKEMRVVDRDEHPRAETTAEDLARLEPLLGPRHHDARPSDTFGPCRRPAAHALLLASKAAACRFGLAPFARVRALARAGVPPRRDTASNRAGDCGSYPDGPRAEHGWLRHRRGRRRPSPPRC